MSGDEDVPTATDVPPSSDEVRVAISYEHPSPKRQRSLRAIAALALIAVPATVGVGEVAGGTAGHRAQARPVVGQPMSMVASSGAKLDQDDDPHDPGERGEDPLR